MKYLLFASIGLFIGCSSAYKDLQSVEADSGCLKKFVPAFQSQWYRASVMAAGRYISGLLLIKKMPDSSHRFVFTNEAGVKFFDFEFSGNRFTVHQVIRQLDKKAVVNTLRKDFEMLLMVPVMAGDVKQFQRGHVIFHGFRKNKEINYFVTDWDCTALLAIEKASDRKKKVVVQLFNRQDNVPDSVSIQHFLINMQINLKKLDR